MEIRHHILDPDAEIELRGLRGVPDAAIDHHAHTAAEPSLSSSPHKSQQPVKVRPPPSDIGCPRGSLTIMPMKIKTTTPQIRTEFSQPSCFSRASFSHSSRQSRTKADSLSPGRNDSVGLGEYTRPRVCRPAPSPVEKNPRSFTKRRVVRRHLNLPFSFAPLLLCGFALTSGRSPASVTQTAPYEKVSVKKGVSQ